MIVPFKDMEWETTGEIQLDASSWLNKRQEPNSLSKQYCTQPPRGWQTIDPLINQHGDTYVGGGGVQQHHTDIWFFL